LNPNPEPVLWTTGMAGIGKLLALKSRRGPPAVPHIGAAPLTAMLEGERLRALSGGPGALGSIPTSDPPSPPAPYRATSWRGGRQNSLALRRIPICADWRRLDVSRDSRARVLLTRASLPRCGA
jgi:hypothetical protein